MSKVSEDWQRFSFGIITVSDRCHKGQSVDESGPEIKQMLQKLSASKIFQVTVPDEIEEISNMLKYFTDSMNLNCVITTGGTGFASRDVTPEATKSVIEKEAMQLSLAMSLESFKKTPFAALSRAVCGIRKNTLIVNLPGSKKAVVECFQAIQSVIPHAIELILDQKVKTDGLHKKIQQDSQNKSDDNGSTIQKFSDYVPHVCPHKTGNALDKNDRNSIYPMIDVAEALAKIFSLIKANSASTEFQSPIDYPPFRASIKDGYAVKSVGGITNRKVVGFISAGDSVIRNDFAEDECFKINTGAAVPEFADSVVQIEDTEILKQEKGIEKEIKLNTIPTPNCDIRPTGCDLKKGETLFHTEGFLDVPRKTILASVGIDEKNVKIQIPKIAIISTGDELVEVGVPLDEGKIFDSNTIMLKSLLEHYGFRVTFTKIVKDDRDALKKVIQDAMQKCDVIISSGGVSMGDKDFVKPLLMQLKFDIIFGRVNMKPGKPMTFGYNKGKKKSYFGLPGNPNSAYVCFHIFILPSLRNMMGYPEAKCKLPQITTILAMDKYVLDSRPEYARGMIYVKNGTFYSLITGEQMSSRIKSLIDADVLLHLPGATEKQKLVNRGYKLQATILNPFFVSKYE